MDNKLKRIILYLIGCMGARTTLTYIVKNHPDKYKNILTAMLLIPAFGFAYIYLNDLRKTGGEVFGDKIWWNNLRPLHSILYFITALLVFLKQKNAFYFLAIDTLIGLVAFALYHLGIIYKS